jgi:hypothetical protein
MCRGQTNRTSEGGEKRIRGSSVWNGGAWGSNPRRQLATTWPKSQLGRLAWNHSFPIL